MWIATVDGVYMINRDDSGLTKPGTLHVSAHVRADLEALKRKVEAASAVGQKVIISDIVSDSAELRPYSMMMSAETWALYLTIAAQDIHDTDFHYSLILDQHRYTILGKAMGVLRKLKMLN